MLSRWPKLFLLILLIVTIGLIGLVWWRLSWFAPTSGETVSPTTSLTVIDPGQLKANYEQAVDELVADYQTANRPLLINQLAGSDRQQWIDWFDVNLTKLLDLRVPGGYRDWHLQMAIAVQQMGEALTDDVTDDEFLTRQGRLDELVTHRPWLVTAE